jgi:hypothetical protein
VIAVVWLLIVVPLLVAGGTSALLVWRETAAANGAARARGAPRAAGFGQGGQPTPMEGSGEAGLKTFLEPDYWRPAWIRALRIVMLAVIMAAAATAIAVALYLLGRWAGDAIRNFVTKG